MLSFCVRARSRVMTWLQSTVAMLARLRAEKGQTTAEYALVILAAAAVAIVLIAWARSSGKLPGFFDHIIDEIAGTQ
jgi:Flp pilus assembly pilin Flp